MSLPVSFTDPACPWSGWELGPLITCEERLCSWVRQPMNTASNLAIVLVALTLFWSWRRGKSRTDLEFAVLAMIIGVSSILAHATQTKWFSLGDYSSQFLLLSYVALRNLALLAGDFVRWTWVAGLALLFAIPSLFDKRLGTLSVTVLVILYLATEAQVAWRRKEARFGYFQASLVVFAAAATCFALDMKKIVCIPENHWVQLHSVWHVLVAASLYFLSLHFKAREEMSCSGSISVKTDP